MLHAARAACRSALTESEDLAPLWIAKRRGHAALRDGCALLHQVRTDGEALSRLARIKAALRVDGYPVDGGAFERMLIVAAALDAVDRLVHLPIDDRVRDLFCQNFQLYAATPERLPETPDLGRSSFIAMARIATLSRFPAGQLDWEVSGIPQSWLFKVPKRSLPRLAASIVFELRGLQPTFFSHVNPNRRNQGLLLERESLRSYHRMACSMERQPHIRGLITASWLHSPDTFAVSPHLAWLNEVFLENGGHVVPLGPVHPDSGVMHRSPERRQAYEAGTFTPTEALVIWPRAAMLAWAAAREDLCQEQAVRPEAAMSMREARA